MAPGRRLISIAAVLGALLPVLLCAPAALALFTSSGAAGPTTVASATLGAPNSVSAKQVNCQTEREPQVEVVWGAPSGGIAPGYAIERATSSTGKYTLLATVSSSARTYTDTKSSLQFSTAYYYRVVSAYKSWATAASPQNMKTLSSSCR